MSDMWVRAQQLKGETLHTLAQYKAFNIKVFNGPMLTDLDERIEYGEDRWVSISILYQLTVVIVWTARNGDIIRIISARKANKYERQRYEAYLTNRLGRLS